VCKFRIFSNLCGYYKFRYTKSRKEEMEQSLEALHPIGHLGEPRVVAYGVLYLASDEAKFVTGQAWSYPGDTPCNSASCFGHRLGLSA
jgi:NAD(P)-dependent dehydrogenase (short-subunit alcohol dehydrogenase family)